MSIRIHSGILIATGLAMAAACTPAADPGDARPDAPVDPVVVYAAYDDRDYLPVLMNEYTRESGVIVIVRNAAATAIVDDVIENTISPPADVLITPNVDGVWRAAEEGDLRPMQSEFSEGQVAPWLRDPDSYWTAWNYRRAVLAYRPDRIEAAELSDFAALGGPYFKGRLCLASSADSISQAVVATLIDELGVRETELAVRGWVANLGAPLFDTEGELLEGIASGACAAGIVSSDNFAAAAASNADVPYRLFDPETVVVEVEAMGVTRHARNPDGGRKLIEWLLEDDVRARHAAAVFAEPARMEAVDRKNVSRVALYREDAVKLAERARYR